MPYNEKISGQTSNQDKMKKDEGKKGIEKKPLVKKTNSSKRQTGRVR